MKEDQTMSVKAHLIGTNGRQEVRRFGIAESLATNFSVLKEKIGSVFGIRNEDIVISWKDSEGDNVTISTDEELVEAIADSLSKQKLQVFHIYVSTKDNAKQGNQGGDCHEGVTCDGCGGGVLGFRYKCMTCYDFDLCGSCEAKGIHKEHKMIRIPKANAMPRARGGPNFWWKEHAGPRGLFSPRFGVHTGMGSNNGRCGWQPRMGHGYRHCNRNGAQGNGGKNCGGASRNTGGGCWRRQNQTASGCPHKQQQQKQESQQAKSQEKEQKNQSSNDQQNPSSNTSSGSCPFKAENNAPEQVADAIKGIFTALSGQQSPLFEIFSALSGQEPNGFGEASFHQKSQNKKPQENGRQNESSNDQENSSNNSSTEFCPFFSEGEMPEKVADVIKGIFTGLSGPNSPIFDILTALSGQQPHGFGATPCSQESQHEKSQQKEQQKQSSNGQENPSNNSSTESCPFFSEGEMPEQVADVIKGIFTGLSGPNSPIFDILTALSGQQPHGFGATPCSQESQHEKSQQKEQQKQNSNGQENPSNNTSSGPCPFFSEGKAPEQVTDGIKGIFTALSGQQSPLCEILTALSGKQPSGFESTPFSNNSKPSSYSNENGNKNPEGRETQNQQSRQCSNDERPEEQFLKSVIENVTSAFEPLGELHTPTSLSQQPSGCGPAPYSNHSKASSSSNDNGNRESKDTETQDYHSRQWNNEVGEPDVNTLNRLDCDDSEDNDVVRQCCSQDEDDIQIFQIPTSKKPSTPNPLLEAHTNEDMPVDTESRSESPSEIEFNNMAGTEIELKSDAEEWTMVNGNEQTAEARLHGGAKPKNPPSQRRVQYPDLQELRPHPDTKIQQALEQMQAMGYHNEGGWLTNILEMKQGDINQVLDMLQPLNK